MFKVNSLWSQFCPTVGSLSSVYLLGGVSHCNEPVGDVGEVQVVAVALVPVLLFGHHGLDDTGHVAEKRGRDRLRVTVNRRGGRCGGGCWLTAVVVGGRRVGSAAAADRAGVARPRRRGGRRQNYRRRRTADRGQREASVEGGVAAAAGSAGVRAAQDAVQQLDDQTVLKLGSVWGQDIITTLYYCRTKLVD